VRLDQIIKTVDGKIISAEVDLTIEIDTAFGADLMSDVLAFVHTGTMLLTGLTNPQAVRTAEMAGVTAILFVRGKYPPAQTIALAAEKGVPLLWSPYTMYETCGRLYQAGLRSGGLLDLASETWDEGFNNKA
jgi:predicted transcriptional regulator